MSKLKKLAVAFALVAPAVAIPQFAFAASTVQTIHVRIVERPSAPTFRRVNWSEGRGYGHGRFGDSIDRRQAYQRHEIDEAFRRGQLTRREAQRLWAEQRRIEHEERHYEADGHLSRNERADLNDDLNRASRHLYNERHDGQYRY